MPAPISASPRMTRPLALLAVVGGVLVAATVMLWVHYGTTVFFELVRSGWAACFG